MLLPRNSGQRTPADDYDEVVDDTTEDNYDIAMQGDFSQDNQGDNKTIIDNL